MSSNPIALPGGAIVTGEPVWYSGANRPLVGQAVCLSPTQSSRNLRQSVVEDPTLANIGYFYGVVVNASPARDSATNLWTVYVLPKTANAAGITVLTDENVAVGDWLAPVPGSRNFGKATIGEPVLQCAEAVDRTATAGSVSGIWGLTRTTPDKLIAVDENFISGGSISATADLGPFVLLGTSATATFSDALAAEPAAANLRARGVLTVAKQNAAANVGYAQYNGEPFQLRTGSSLFMRARAAVSAMSANIGGFLGFAPAATTDPVGASGTDFVGFSWVNAALQALYTKDGTSQAIFSGNHASWATQSGVATLVAATFVDLAILVRNRSASAKDVLIWADGVRIAHTATVARIVDDESLTFIAGLRQVTDTGTPGLSLDSLAIRNYAE